MPARTHNDSANVSYQEFHLLGFPGLQESRFLLFIPFFCLYVMIVAANSLLIYTVKVERSLHSPMYLLIALLLATNLCCTTTVVPRMLLSFLFDVSRISLTGCLVQMFFLYFFLMLDCTILLMMALDRYVAVCNPLRYADVMTNKLLIQLTAMALVRSVSFVSPVVILASQVRYCRSNIIRHFVCEHMALICLSCGDVSRNKIVGLTMRSITIIFDLGFLLMSYSRITHAALKMASGNIRHKAFHTCGTHLIVILIFYFSSLSSSVVYRVGKSVSQDMHNLISAIYLLVPCAVNPIIYGLRTKEVRQHLLKLFKRRGSVFIPFRKAALNTKE
ncbi:olfactory receptor 52K1-like [Alligator sinensis]|uniref:Olfactory receptor n=1 Tax=Alligator sinensis TaxID=38654 RepID=A0A1U7S6K9_ALLSI|nr:olfactory receptor 52K1-like [Alligator sinensis]